MRVVIVVILFQIFLQASSRTFLIPYFRLRVSQYQCLASAGYNRVAMQIYGNSTSIDVQDYQNWQNALNAGLNVDLIYVPYTYGTVEMEIQFMLKNFSPINTRYWIDLNMVSPTVSICSFLFNLTTQMRDKLKLNVGIMTNQHAWIYNFKSSKNCLALSRSNPLWWTPEGLDGQPNFDSFVPFASWKTPQVKIYQETKLCGQNLMEAYYV